MQHQIEVTPW